MSLINWNFWLPLAFLAVIGPSLLRRLRAFVHTISKKLRQGFRSEKLAGLSGTESLAAARTLQKFKDSPLRTLLDWKKNGGKLVYCWLGEFRVLVINDLATLKRAFSKPAFNGRPPFLPAILFSGGDGHGTLTSSGDTWKLVRNHAVSNLNKNGFGKGPSSVYAAERLDSLVEQLGKKCGMPLDLRPELYSTISSCVWYTLVGDEMTNEDMEKSKQAFMNLHEHLWEPITSAIWLRPSLAPAAYPEKLENLRAAILPFHSIIKNEITQTLEEGKANFLTSFVSSLEKDGMSQEEIEMHLHGTFMNLWHTAGETLNNVLRWAILYLTLYPSVQQKLAHELLSKKDYDPEGLPYLKAVVKELLRISSSSPFANFHYTMEDTEIDGSSVPRGTMVIGNLYGIHHDPETFSDPETFNPERFLSSEAGFPDTIPFSLGLRACLGQAFAKNFLHRALAVLVKEFAFFWDPAEKTMTKDDITDLSKVSVFRFTPQYKVVLMRRKYYGCS